MKRKIAIIAGGDSSEHAVSMKSAEGIRSFIDANKYDIYLVELSKEKWEAVLPEGNAPVDKNDFSFVANGERIRPDFAYITIHGTPGENGILQGYFELIGLPYSTCDVLVSALTFSKFHLNQYLKSLGLKVAESLVVNRRQSISEQDIIETIGLPCFIKPNASGSSFGVTKVKTVEDIRPALETAFAESDDVMVEAFMDGTEIANGCYKVKGKEVVLPITEVVSKNEFFDFNAKYNGEVTEITPARLSEEVTARVQKLTSLIYDILKCKGIIRVDYIITAGDVINMLEVNTTPGMTATSFIPQQVRAAGLDIKEVMTDIIEDAFLPS
ncbi:MAG: D-alanine--D-alanine ligase [Phocaeicola sp.]|nr:D-alanine--D-alanine ligase [Phocaeicola sp.]